MFYQWVQLIFSKIIFVLLHTGKYFVTMFLFSSLCQMHFLELLFQILDPENHFELDFLLQMSWTTAFVIPNQYSLWPSAWKADFKKW